MSNATKFRAAIIGAGQMANKVHYPSIASLPDVDIAAIADLDTNRLNATADQYHVEKRYTNYQKMVEEIAPDAIYVIGPPHIMYDIWTWCLQEGQNLYIEKPLGITFHQAQILCYLADKHNCITQVSFQRRGCPLFRTLREKCITRGPIFHAVCQFYKLHTSPRLIAWDHITGDAVHAIDTLRWMCGGEVVDVHSVVKRIGMPSLNYYSAIVQFDNGATGVINHSWRSARRIFRVEMHGEGICAEAEHEGDGYLYADGDTTGTFYSGAETANSEDYVIRSGFQARHREFVDCVRAGTQPESCFSDALKTMEVSEKILASALHSGAWSK